MYGIVFLEIAGLSQSNNL